VIDFTKLWRRKTQASGALDATPFRHYVRSGDYRRNAVDLLPGWNHGLPPEAGVDVGGGGLYNDNRVLWALEQHGGVAGARVLELGPMEAGHSYMLERAGASVDAVEANGLAFLKCLVVKELVGLKARFYLAEANCWLRESSETYDLAVASGVLYHMRDPLTLLELLAQKAPALFLWTHYVEDSERAAAERDNLPYLSIDRRFGFDVRLFERSYFNAEASAAFCGGVFDNPRWMFREDLLRVLGALGYDDIRIAFEERTHQNGPCFSVYARKSAAA
jgi:hypothetical protein